MSDEDEVPHCPQCGVEIALDVREVDLYVCPCESMIYIKPFGEWFARWSVIERYAAKMAAADPKLVERVREVKRSTES